jgi:retinol dehydrogenase-14
VLFTRQLAKRLDADSVANANANSTATATVAVNAAHPGPVRSSFGMDGDLHGFMGLGMRLVRPFEISPRRGAKTSLYLATSPAVAGKTGMYWVRSKPGHMSRQARDDAAAARLWDESARLLASVGYPVV